MAACNSDIHHLGDAINRLFRIRAQAEGAKAIIGLDGASAKSKESVMDVYFILDEVGQNLKDLAQQIDAYDLRTGMKGDNHVQQ